jgi:NAD(P)-dependent dehydrogenase (short-subunit alcohol dehydrogenase family)
MQLEGKVALVTGGASGIGRATARRFASEGARVAIVDLNEDEGTAVARELGGWFGRADVGDLDQMQSVVDTVVRDLGGLDIAYLNAGVTTGERDIWSLTPQAYRRAVGVNVDGVVFGARAAVPAMTNGGALIATASLAGLVAYPGDPIYSLTKHAVVGFVRSAAEQLAERNITINAVCPGFTETAMLEGFVEAFQEADFPLLQPDDVAGAVLTAVTSGQTGQVFVCQPGRTCEPYKFRGVPGPRAEGAEGMEPPVRPSAG